MKTVLAILLLIASCSAQEVVFAKFRGSGGGGGITPTASGGASSACRGLGGSTFTCGKDTTPGYSAGDYACVWTTYQEMLTPTVIAGGTTLTSVASATLNFGTSVGDLSCGLAGSGGTSVSVSGPSGGSFVRIRWISFTPPVSATPNGSQGSSYVINSTTINTGVSAFANTAHSLVVAGLYGVNGGTPGGITPGSGWTASTVGWTSGGCDTDGGAFSCIIYQLDSGSGSTTDPNATQAVSDVRMAAGVSVK